MMNGKYDFPPTEADYGAIRYADTDDDERELLMERKEIKKLIEQNRLDVNMYDLWIWEDDSEAREILDRILYGYDVND